MGANDRRENREESWRDGHKEEWEKWTSTLWTKTTVQGEWEGRTKCTASKDNRVLTMIAYNLILKCKLS